MGVRIRFQGGTMAGTVLDFDDSKTEIRFGRNPTTCNVVFPADETKVSREHFALRRVVGQYRLITNLESPVYVEGELGHDDQIIASLTELRVGKLGPKLIVEIVGEHGLLPTEGEKIRGAGRHTMMARLSEKLGRHARATAVGLGVLVVAVVSLTFFLHRLRSDVVHAQDALVALDQKASAEIVAAIQDFAQKNPDTSKFRQLTPSLEPSVLLVLVQSPGGDPEPIATAWVVRDGLVATNGHVAREFSKLPQDSSMLVRTSGEHPSDFKVTAVEVHPGFEQFEAMNREYAPRDSVTGQPSQFITACDVAVMRVTPLSGASLPPPLALASSAEVLQLHSGEVVSTIGYPQENLASRNIEARRPQPVMQVGNITSLTDFFQGSASPDGTQLIHHNLPGVGGASGSPVFNLQGKVIAIHCAGNFTFLPHLDWRGKPVKDSEGATDTLRIPTPGYNFAQRLDVLRELLDGKSTELQAKRNDQWRSNWDDLRVRGHRWVVANVDTIVIREIMPSIEEWLLQQGFEPGGPLARIGDIKGEIAGTGRDGGAGSKLAAKSVHAGIYIATAVANEPADIHLTAVKGTDQPIDGQGELGFSVVYFASQGSEDLKLLAHRTADLPTPTTFGLSVYYLPVRQKKKPE